MTWIIIKQDFYGENYIKIILKNVREKNHIFTLNQIGEKAREKKYKVCVGFIDLENAYNRVNRESM